MPIAGRDQAAEEMSDKTSLRYTCPKCNVPMVKVRSANRKTSPDFYGCSAGPECTYTMPIPEREKMLDIGAPELPL